MLLHKYTSILKYIFDHISLCACDVNQRLIIAKAYKRLNLLRVVSSLSENPNPNMLVTLYKSIIRPIFEYPSLCIINAAACHIQKMQLLQNQALRVVLKIPSYVSIKDLHDCTGVPPILDHLVSFAKQRLQSMKKTSPLVNPVIEEYNSVSNITENASVLDVILNNCP